MSDEEETYCRLCAEPTPKDDLITTEDDVAIHSKVPVKMRWINVDISSSTLPSTICFSCFDLLERTWSFLHNVRTAQKKLLEIFAKEDNKTLKENNALKTESDDEKVDNTGKPIDVNWEEFQDNKSRVKKESPESVSGADNSLIVDIAAVKQEPCPDGFDDNDYNSSDSDIPLHLAVKQKKLKKKKKKTYLFIDEHLYSKCLTWDDYICRCPKCDAQCKNVESLRLHSIQIHGSCTLFKCNDCGKVINKYKTFVNHVRKHWPQLKKYCEHCNVQFSTPEFVKKHRDTEHADAILTTCKNCGSSFSSSQELQDHILNYNRELKKTKYEKLDDIKGDLTCEHCNKKFKSKSNLLQHKVVHTDRSRNFSCHVCGKMFFTKGTLSTHMTTHEEVKPFKCEYCPLSFRARGNLNAHASMHSGVKPFVCELCGKCFRVKRHLKSHSIVHTDLMPYVCQYCNKTFRFKTRLNLHLRQHTGAKPYNCVYCQRQFTNGSNYKKHMIRRHHIDTSRKNNFSNIVIKTVDDVNKDLGAKLEVEISHVS